MSTIDILKWFSDLLYDRGKAENTIKSYFRIIRAFLLYVNQSGMDWDQVSSIDMQEWRIWSIRQGISAATINQRIAAVKYFYSEAGKAGLCSINPAKEIRGVSLAAIAPKWMEKSSVRKLKKAMLDRIERVDSRRAPKDITPSARYARRDRAIVLLMLCAGLRVGEVVSLLLSDLTINPRGGEVRIREGKGRRSRVVPLNLELRKALQDWIDYHPALTVDMWNDNGGWLFVSAKGRLLDRGVQVAVKRCLRLAGLNGVTVSAHTLRHTCAKMMLDQGVPLTEVSMILGHANLSTTAIYTVPSKDDLQSAVEKISY